MTVREKTEKVHLQDRMMQQIFGQLAVSLGLAQQNKAKTKAKQEVLIFCNNRK